MPRPWNADLVRWRALRHHSATARRGFKAAAEKTALELLYAGRSHRRLSTRVMLYLHMRELIPRPLRQPGGYDVLPLHMFDAQKCGDLFRFCNVDELDKVRGCCSFPTSLIPQTRETAMQRMASLRLRAPRLAW